MSVDLSAVDDGLGNAIAAAAGGSPATALAALTRVMAATDRDPSTDYPYLTIGAYDVQENGTGCADAVTAIIPIHIWTREAGFKQCKQINAALFALLDDAPFAVAGHRITGCFYRGSRFMRDPQRGIRHGIAEFIVHVDKDP